MLFTPLPLAENLEFKNGQSSPERSYNGEFFVYGSNGIIGNSNKSNSSKNTIIIGRVGSYCGSLYYSKRPCWVTDNAIICKSKNNDDRFWYYALLNLNLSRLSSGSGQSLINQSVLQKTFCATPSFEDREKIASVLGSLDDKIDLNRRTNETLEAMARALFRDWFVNFGPTRAKMAGEAPYLAPELWELFPDRLDDEGKPEEWLDGTIGNWANLNSLSWKRQNYPETVNYLDLSSVKHGIINDISQISAQEAPSRAQRILRTGETVIGTVRPGNGSYAYIDREGLTGSTGFACFYAEDKKFREFVYFALTDKENIDRLTHLADGGAYPAVRPDVVADTACTLSEQTVSAFHTVVSSWMNKISTNNIESHTLAQLRDLLLPKLMSGEISIRDAEKMVEDAA